MFFVVFCLLFFLVLWRSEKRKWISLSQTLKAMDQECAQESGVSGEGHIKSPYFFKTEAACESAFNASRRLRALFWISVVLLIGMLVM